MTVVENLERVRDRIARAGGDLDRISIVAVTKGLGVDAVHAAVDAGVRDVGENYAQELVAKSKEAPAARWHFLGTIQRNKVARLAPVVAVWQGVDRLAAGAEIAARSPGATVLVQVNVSGAAARNGCTPQAAPALVAELRTLDLDVAGLMAVGSAAPPDAARSEFERLAAVGATVGARELSMGMSDDLEVAVAAGSTMVRVGRALFGPRVPRE